MCYRHGTVSFNRPCPSCGAPQCNEQMYCTECGALMPYEAPPEYLHEEDEPESLSEE